MSFKIINVEEAWGMGWWFIVGIIAGFGLQFVFWMSLVLVEILIIGKSTGIGHGKYFDSDIITEQMPLLISIAVGICISILYLIFIKIKKLIQNMRCDINEY